MADELKPVFTSKSGCVAHMVFFETESGGFVFSGCYLLLAPDGTFMAYGSYDEIREAVVALDAKYDEDNQPAPPGGPG